MSRSVIAAVIEKNGTYLVCQRPPEKRHGGLWEFPGGKVEDGESTLEAARRELAEELDMHATAERGGLFSIVDQASGYTINFVRILAEGEPKLLEHTACAWLSLKEL